MTDNYMVDYQIYQYTIQEEMNLAIYSVFGFQSERLKTYV